MKRVYRAEAVVPDLLPAEVHAQESVVAQIGVDPLPVGRRRARGVTVLPVGAFGIRLRGESLPEQLTVGTAQAENRTPPPVVIGGRQEIRSPQMMGEEFPLPGNSTFQRTFSWSDQVLT